MGINYAIDAEARIVRLNYVSEPTIEELTATMKAIFRATDYRPGFGFLIDRRQIPPPTREFVERLIAFMTLQRTALARARWAVIAPTAAGYGMGQMDQALGENARLLVPIHVFKEAEEAETWLRETSPGE